MSHTPDDIWSVYPATATGHERPTPLRSVRGLDIAPHAAAQPGTDHTAADVPADADARYAELTVRNRDFVSASAQQRLRTATVLVAGCGSTGGAAVEPLVRLGVQRFLLADNGSYELNNLNRQSAERGDLGRNKAQVCAERLLAVNPDAGVGVYPQGITSENVDRLVAACDLVVDGVDVTERAGWRAKLALHEAAARAGRPVLTGYDMAGAQYIRFHDYRRRGRAFDGRISAHDVERRTTWELLRRAVPLRFVPVEMLDSARRTVATGGEQSVPQVVYASLLFGALASRMAVEILDDRPVRRHTFVDAHRAVRPGRVRLAVAARRPVVLLLALRDLATHRSTGGGQA